MHILPVGSIQVETDLNIDIQIWESSYPMTIEEHPSVQASPVKIMYSPMGTGLSGGKTSRQLLIEAIASDQSSRFGDDYKAVLAQTQYNADNFGVYSMDGFIHVLPLSLNSSTGSVSDRIQTIQTQPGTKFIRVYCSNNDSSSLVVKLGGEAFSELYTPPATIINGAPTIDSNGDLHESGPIGVYQPDAQRITTNTIRFVSRERTTVYESITWNGDVRHSLKYPYDNPDVSLIGATNFYDKFGNLVVSPGYNKLRGEFIASTDCYGAYIVKYDPFVSVFSINYELADDANGVYAAKANWLNGAFSKTGLTPIYVIAVARDKSSVSAFQREFTPSAPPVVDNIDVSEVAGTRKEVVTTSPFGSGNLEIHNIIGIGCQDSNGRTFQLRLMNSQSLA